MAVCNTTLAHSDVEEDPIWGSITFHRFGLWIAAIFGILSVIISLFLMTMHARHYLRPFEQRHIIRILLMIPVYSVVSYLSFLFYHHAVYFQVLRDCYEAFAIASFFTLLCNYIAPTLHDQKEYFRTIEPKNWFWGVFGLQKCTGGPDKGPFRRPRSGLTWFNVIWVGVFQYCLIRVLFTIVSVIAQANDVYCEESNSPQFAHIWVSAFEAISVSIAMFCLIQFYLQLREDLSEHRPFFKVLCIKLVIFLSFWQTILISLLSSGEGPLQPTRTLDYQDIKVGIPAVLLCIEMAIFAVMHVFAFSWEPYSLKKHMNPLTATGLGYSSGETPHYYGGRFGWKAFADAFNPWDLLKATARGLRWLFVGRRRRHADVSYQRHSKAADGTSAGYVGPVYTGTNEAATELTGATTHLGGRNQPSPDDRIGLLRTQQIGHTGGRLGDRRRDSYDSAFGPPSDLSQSDVGSQAGHPRTSFDKIPPYAEDTGYHSVPTAASEITAIHPALRPDGRDYDRNWNFVAGVNINGDQDLHPGFRPPPHAQ